MSIRDALLVLLAEKDQYGYELRSAFEERTGGAWPLNIGQVYTTLDRLERDGLVERRDGGDDRQVHYAITSTGRDAASAWWNEPVVASAPSRDDAALKIILAASSPGVDARQVIQSQRRAAMVALQDLTRARRASGDDAWSLVADAMIFRAEAEVRWLDHVETRLARSAARAGATPRVPTQAGREQATTASPASAADSPAPAGSTTQGAAR